MIKKNLFIFINILLIQSCLNNSYALEPDEILKDRISPIKTAHDGLVQQNDVFTNSLRSTPGGRGRERGVSRDVF